MSIHLQAIEGQPLPDEVKREAITDIWDIILEKLSLYLPYNGIPDTYIPEVPADPEAEPPVEYAAAVPGTPARKGRLAVVEPEGVVYIAITNDLDGTNANTWQRIFPPEA